MKKGNLQPQRQMEQLRSEIKARKKERARKEKEERWLNSTLAGVLLGAAVGLSLSAIVAYGLVNEPYEKPTEQQIKAIDGDYYYSASDYSQYLEERAAARETTHEAD